MIDLNKRIIELIANGRTLNEISTQLNITHKQIYARLKTLQIHGFEFEREYHYNGNIKYIPQNKAISTEREGIDLITKATDQQINIMLISDIHIGSKYDEIELLNKIYDYCINNNINIIINAGDLIDGLSFGMEKRINSFEKQIDFLIKNYPFDKNIINFICLGNHDLDSFTSNNQDIATALSNLRHDLVPLGYCLGNINIKNESIYVKHHINDFPSAYIPNESLILLGHSHKASIYLNGNLYVHIPTLSNLNNDNCGFPSAMVMSITFKNGYFKMGHFEQLLIADKIYKINEYISELFPNRIFKKKNQTILEENDSGTYLKNFDNIQTNNQPKSEQKKLSRKQKKKTK